MMDLAPNVMREHSVRQGAEPSFITFSCHRYSLSDDLKLHPALSISRMHV